MPPPRPRVLLLGLAALAAATLLALLAPRPAGAGPSPRAGRWRWPVHGAVVGRFAYERRSAFASGARRGIDIAAAPGAGVRSACAGRVTFTGPLPGGRGLGVTVRCGALVATHLGLGRVAVRRGARVAGGTRLGTVGPAGRVRLGARRASDRYGYVDPLALLRRGAPTGVPALPAPAGRRAPRLPSGSRPAGRPAPLGRAPVIPLGVRVAPAGAHADVPASLAPRLRPASPARPGAAIPAGAWAGLVLLAAGVPLGGLVRRRRARRVPVAAATTPAAGR